MPSLPSHLENNLVQFPIICGEGRIAGLRTDGKAFDLPIGDALNRVPTLSNVKSLCVRPLHDDATIVERRVLYERMPRLEHLFIETVFHDPKHPGRHLFPPECTLHTTNYPALRTLIVCNTSVKLDLPICRRLQVLHLQVTDNDQPCLPLDEFLEVMRNSWQLKELHVKNYVNVFARTPDLPLVQLHSHQQLKHFTLVARLQAMSTILSHLVIPEYVTFSAVGHVFSNPHTAFHTMLPDDPLKLQMFQHATELRAHDTGDRDCFLTASTDRASFALELHSPYPSGNGEGNSRNGTLIHAMLRSWDMFRGSPVKTAEIVGALDDITPASWDEALDRFPSIENLVIEDLHKHPLESLQPLLHALASQSRVHPGVACSRLRSLKLTLSNADAWLVDLIFVFLSSRTQLGAPPLQRLDLTLCHPDRTWTAAWATRAHATLASVASVVEVKASTPSAYMPGRSVRGRKFDA